MGRLREFFFGKSVDTPAPVNTAPAAAAPYTIRSNGGNGGAKWLGGLSRSGRLSWINHVETRRNARNAMHDSMQARAIVERFADSVADTGLRLELTPQFDILGMSEEAATAWARNVESRFHLWASDKRQHRSEQLTWYQTHWLYQLFQQRDNDIFVRYFYESDTSLQNPLQYDFIDPDQIRGDASTYNAGFQGGEDGITRDSRGREVSYKIWVRRRDDSGAERFDEVNIPARVGNRWMMIHGFRGEYAGQTRGYSRLAHAIQEFENITDFSAATIKKAINQSMIFAAVEPSADEDASNPLEDLINSTAGAGPRPSSVIGTAADPSNVVPSDEYAPGMNAFYQVPEATVATPGGLLIANLTKGSKLKPFENTSPGDSFDNFVDAFSCYLAASHGIPLEVVLMKFGSNFSASRATLLLFWRTCEMWRREMAADYLNPTLEMWMSGEIAAGRIVAPGWSDPRLRAAWLSCNWIGSSAPDIDPGKTATARRMNIETGVTNLEREARDYNSSNAAANLAANRRLFELMPQSPWTPSGASVDDAKKDKEDDKD